MEDTITIGAHEFTVEYPYDYDHGAPWEENDGHGIVSDWVRRKKAPGERVLSQDRGSYRYYDIAASLVIAKRDKWGVAGGKHGNETDRQYAVRAVEADYDFLYGWANDQWAYVGVVVTSVEDPNESDSIFGIEGNAYAYLAETAHELAEGIAERLDAKHAVTLAIDYGFGL